MHKGWAVDETLACSCYCNYILDEQGRLDLLVIAAVQCAQCASVPNSSFSSFSEKGLEQTTGLCERQPVGRSSESGLSGRLHLYFSQKHNGMINTSGIQLVEERVNPFFPSFPSVKKFTL